MGWLYDSMGSLGNTWWKYWCLLLWNPICCSLGEKRFCYFTFCSKKFKWGFLWSCDDVNRPQTGPANVRDSRHAVSLSMSHRTSWFGKFKNDIHSKNWFKVSVSLFSLYTLCILILGEACIFILKFLIGRRDLRKPVWRFGVAKC